jgi:hypothetical protein
MSFPPQTRSQLPFLLHQGMLISWIEKKEKKNKVLREGILTRERERELPQIHSVPHSLVDFLL